MVSLDMTCCRLHDFRSRVRCPRPVTPVQGAGFEFKCLEASKYFTTGLSSSHVEYEFEGSETSATPSATCSTIWQMR
jgi:hypothetical protein